MGLLATAPPAVPSADPAEPVGGMLAGSFWVAVIVIGLLLFIGIVSVLRIMRHR